MRIQHIFTILRILNIVGAFLQMSDPSMREGNENSYNIQNECILSCDVPMN